MTQQAEPEVHYRTCTLCEAMCGIAITHRDGQIESIRGDEQDPFSRGHICPKAVALKDLHEDPDRLRQPMLRTDEGWREIGWPEALDRAAEGLRAVQRAHGRDAVATYLGNPNAHSLGNMLFGRTLHQALRSRQRFSATSVDQLPHHIVAHHLFGHQLRLPVPDINRTDFMLMLGANPVASNGSLMTVANVKQKLKDILARGGEVVVIDPRRTETAEIASAHHFIRPGSDALLMLAMLHEVFATGRVKQESRALQLCDGLDEIAAAVADWPPERVAAHTGISAEVIRDLVARFCAAPRAVCYGRMGVSVQEFGLLTQYLVTLFNIVTGRLDEEGGVMFTRPAADILGYTGPGRLGKHHTRVRGLPDFGSEFPVSSMAEEMLTPGDGQIRALVTVAGNPVLSTPNGEQLDRALAQLDFIVSIDFYLNETTRHAHLILPPVGPLERSHYDLVFHLLAVHNTAKYSPPLVAPPEGAMQDWQIFMGLAERLQPPRSVRDKLTRAFLRRGGPDALLAMMLRYGPYGRGLKPGGLTLKKLRRAPHGIDLGPMTPSLHQRKRRIPLRPDFYLPDIDRLHAHFFSGEAPGADTTLLIGRRHVRSNNSWLHNSHRLVKGKSRCTLMLHPQHAQQLGIHDGDPVQVRSRVGQVTLVAEVTDAIMPGVVSIPHGWGHQREGVRQRIAQANAGVSVNDLTDDQRIDVLSGNAALNGVPVTLARAV